MGQSGGVLVGVPSLPPSQIADNRNHHQYSWNPFTLACVLCNRLSIKYSSHILFQTISPCNCIHCNLLPFGGLQFLGKFSLLKIDTVRIKWWWWWYFYTATKGLYLNLFEHRRVLSIHTDPYQALMLFTQKLTKKNCRKWKWKTTYWSSTNKNPDFLHSN